MDNILELKTINEIQKFNFYIPSYQRGYRWTPKEVEDLLNDVAEFVPRVVDDSDEKTWYCLQPVVVKRMESGQFEVVDGQQRLTTIYLILYYINERYRDPPQLFDLNYQTRKESSNFLKTLTRSSNGGVNIDFYYILEVYKKICSWFDKPNFNRPLS